MKISRLNEDYLDSAEFRVQRYEDEIPELFHKIHDGYMSGMVNAKAYAEALHRIYDALEELDYDDEEEELDRLYHDASEDELRKMDAFDNMNEEYDDDYDDLSSFKDDGSVKLSSNLFTGKPLTEEDTRSELVKELAKRNLRFNPEKNTIDDAVEYIQQGGKDYSVKQYVDDTLQNYPSHFLKETIDEGFDQSIDLDRVAMKVANLLDLDALGESNWIEFDYDDERTLTSGNKNLTFEAIGETKTIRGHMTTRGNKIEVQLRNGSEAMCTDVEGIARFIAGEFDIAL